MSAQAVYRPYLERHEAEVRLLAREQRAVLPPDLDFKRVAGLSREMQERLNAARPASLDAASRVLGLTPAGYAALAMHLRRHP